MNIKNLCVLLLAFYSLCISASDTIKVACVGNSITYGTGISDREKDSYPSQLQGMLGSNYKVYNFGKPGATLLSKGHRPYIKQEEYNDALKSGADIFVIHLGVNDTDPRNWPNFRDDFLNDYIRLIDSFRSVSKKKCRIIIAQITPIGDRHPRFLSGTKIWQDEIRNKIKTVADIAGVELIDFYSPLYHYPYLFPDAIHPNEEGAEILAKIVYSAITGNYGGLQLPEIYSDNMVFQRNEPIKIHGISDVGEKVTVVFDGIKKATVADNQGNWNVIFNPMSAKDGIRMVVKTSRKKIEFENIAIGEVWLCSGQSNMEFMLKQTIDSQTEISKSHNKGIRLYNMQAKWKTDAVEWPLDAIDSINHLQYYRKTEWKVCDPMSSGSFSAIAYHFGRVLRDSLNVPIGLICNAVGGSTTESWIDRNYLESYFPAILKDWKHNDFVQDWARGRALLNLKKSDRKFDRHPYEPCYLFESGILPLQRFNIKGVIWYQGESNAHNMEAHKQLFKLLVNSWRGYFNKAELPFFYVQLSSLNRPSWTWFRDSQRRLMSEIPNTGMVVSSDKGDSLDVHPKDKKPIGERLSRWALAKCYNCDIEPSGPLFKSARLMSENYVEVSFDYGDGLSSSNGKPISGFELAEYDGLFYPAVAKISNGKLLLSSDKVPHPKFVRYAWQPFTRANLVNDEKLPASTFRAEIISGNNPEENQ